MANYNNKDTFQYNSKKGEVIFADHKLEFLKFFESHKTLCDEISGLKFHNINSINGSKKIVIGKENFKYAIQMLRAFIINYRHYIIDKQLILEVKSKFEELNNEFLNDSNYQLYTKKSDNLTNNQVIEYNKRYINYLSKVFEISYLMSKYLQKSLNITSKEIVKNIQFVNYDGFFNNLSVYRDEVSSDLANISYSGLFDHYKKIMGFFYTYRYLIMKREQEHILDLLKLIYGYMVSDNIIKYVIKIKEGGEITNSIMKDINYSFKYIIDAFEEIYVLCNENLRDKNILPNPKRDVLIDTTLI